MNNNICCFFGHRNAPSEIIPILKEEIENLIVINGVTEFFVGGHGDFDQYSRSAVKSIKKKYSNIKIYLVPAYLSTLESYKNYKGLFESLYDGSVFPDGVELVPQRYAITARNRWMVEQCKHVIVYVNQEHGGAYTAYKYAKKLNRHVVNIGRLNK